MQIAKRSDGRMLLIVLEVLLVPVTGACVLRPRVLIYPIRGWEYC